MSFLKLSYETVTNILFFILGAITAIGAITLIAFNQPKGGKK